MDRNHLNFMNCDIKMLTVEWENCMTRNVAGSLPNQMMFIVYESRTVIQEIFGPFLGMIQYVCLLILLSLCHWTLSWRPPKLPTPACTALVWILFLGHHGE